MKYNIQHHVDPLLFVSKHTHTHPLAQSSAHDMQQTISHGFTSACVTDTHLLTQLSAHDIQYTIPRGFASVTCCSTFCALNDPATVACLSHLFHKSLVGVDVCGEHAAHVKTKHTHARTHAHTHTHTHIHNAYAHTHSC